MRVGADDPGMQVPRIARCSFPLATSIMDALNPAVVDITSKSLSVDCVAAAPQLGLVEPDEKFQGPLTIHLELLKAEGQITVTKGGEPVTVLHPQKRIYRVQTNPMTEAGIDAGLGRDLFVALGEPLGENAWSMRLQYKPLVRLIWGGCLVMAFGGLLAVTDRRYRARVTKSADAPASAAPASV